MTDDLLSGALPPVTLNDAIGELERERELRRRVYPNWIAAGRLKQIAADERNRRLEYAIERLKGLL